MSCLKCFEDFEERVDEEIENMINQGLADVGTDEETILFSKYVNKEITKDELYLIFYPSASKAVGEDIWESRVADVS